VLKAARMMSSSEAIQLLSLVQVGVDVGILEGQVSHAELNQLFLLIQPAHLQKTNGKELGTTERDARRAARIREYFSKVIL
jgi:protein arginine kinase